MEFWFKRWVQVIDKYTRCMTRVRHKVCQVTWVADTSITDLAENCSFTQTWRWMKQATIGCFEHLSHTQTDWSN